MATLVGAVCPPKTTPAVVVPEGAFKKIGTASSSPIINTYSFLTANFTRKTFTAGFNYSLSDKWALNVGTSYTPLDVVRPTPAGGDDNLWNFRMGISLNTN